MGPACVGSESNLVLDASSRNGIHFPPAIRDKCRRGQRTAGTRSRFVSESETNLDPDSLNPVHFEIGLTCPGGVRAPNQPRSIPGHTPREGSAILWRGTPFLSPPPPGPSWSRRPTAPPFAVPGLAGQSAPLRAPAGGRPSPGPPPRRRGSSLRPPPDPRRGLPPASRPHRRWGFRWTPPLRSRSLPSSPP